jgi:hypothetical protein
MKGKKAELLAPKTINYIILILAIGLTVPLLIMIFEKTAFAETRVPAGLDEVLAEYRFLHNPECFAYQDTATGRNYAEIDVEKFTQQRLNACYRVSDDITRACFKLSLTVGGEEKSVQTQNWNRCYLKLPTQQQAQHVLVREQGIRKNGKLLVERKA